MERNPNTLRQRKYNLNQPLSVIVTGAASGIGQAQVGVFLAAGHRVIAVDKDESEQWIKWSENHHDTFSWVKCDVTDPTSVDNMVDLAIARFGKLDVLCNTAGKLDGYATVEETSLEEWEFYLKTNVTSQFIVTKAVLPYLLKNDASRVINMASLASLTAGGGGIAYTAAKHAVAGLTKQLAYDYSKAGLRANAIAPGAIDTPMNRADFEEDSGKMAQWVAEQTPVSRWAQPEEVAQLTLFLASDAADYMQGNIIPLEGGWLIR